MALALSNNCLRVELSLTVLLTLEDEHHCKIFQSTSCKLLMAARVHSLVWYVSRFSSRFFVVAERISNYYLVWESFCGWGFNSYILSNENDSCHSARMTSCGQYKRQCHILSFSLTHIFFEQDRSLTLLH